MSKFVGGLIGFSIAFYAFVYLPMSKNYAECGKVTLCASGMSAETAKTPKGLEVKPASPTAEGGDARPSSGVSS